MSKPYFIKIALLIILISSLIHGEIVLNEFCALNYASFCIDSSYPDWIEIYNSADTAVELTGYNLTDDSSDPFKWTFPAVAIEPGGFLLVIANSECDSFSGPLCTGFGLDFDGDFLGLYDPYGVPLDTITFDEQYRDITTGHPLEALHVFRYLGKPTPGEINDSVWGIGLTPEPEIIPPSGYYLSSQIVEILSPGDIMYSDDLSPPGDSGMEYTSPLMIHSSTVIRANAKETSMLPSQTIGRTYIFEPEPDVPTVFITTDPRNLWNDTVGIYVVGLDSLNPNFLGRGREWERTSWIEVVHDEGTIISVPGGIRIHGGGCRWSGKKAFRILFKDSPIIAPIIPGLDREEYSQVIIRGTGGACFSKIRTPLTQVLGVRCETAVSNFSPSRIYLNDEFWGIYFLRERVDDEYGRIHFGDGEYDVMDSYLPKCGTDELWWSTVDFFETNDLSDDSLFAVAETLIDIWNFVNYQIVNIYGGNTDWPGKNEIRMRRVGENEQWKWIIWDSDYCFGLFPDDWTPVDHNLLAWAIRSEPSPELNPNPNASCGAEFYMWSVAPLRSMLANYEFKKLFINRFADLLNVHLSPDTVIAVIDSLASVVEATITADFERWGGYISNWYDAIDFMRYFVEVRPDFVRGHIIECFELDTTAEVTISPCSGGRVALNTLPPDSIDFSGIYFAGVPIKLHAIPNPGFRFETWNNPLIPDVPFVEIDPAGGLDISPVFNVDSSCTAICINEIMAQNDTTICDGEGEYDDWIELYNSSDMPINLRGCCISDNPEDTFLYCFNDDILIPPLGFVLIWCDNSPEQGVEHTNFALNSDGEWLGIFAPIELGSFLIDSMTFPAMESDISFGRFGDCSDSIAILPYPTPLASNDYVGIEDVKLPSEFEVRISPNPFNSGIRIQGTGNAVVEPVETPLQNGTSTFTWQPDKSTSSGIYLIRIATGSETITKRVMYLK